MLGTGNDTRITNCILWQNGEEIYNLQPPKPTVSYCDIEGCGGSPPSGTWNPNFGIDGGHNIDNDPCFVDAADHNGPDTKWATYDDGLHLQRSSPCIDVADDAVAPLADILGWERFDVPDVGFSVADMGAYETPPGPEDIWEQFKAALRNDDLDSALTFIADSAKEQYTDVLTQLRPYFQDMVDGMGNLVLISTDAERAKYEMLHDEGGGVISCFPVYFSRDSQGKWKIYCF
jgi:hypothetical protein